MLKYRIPQIVTLTLVKSDEIWLVAALVHNL